MRSAYWDNWKGLAIAAVVTIHACSGFPGGTAGSGAATQEMWIRQLTNFAVPFFFAAAGFFAPKGQITCIREFYSSRLLRILPPYLVWTTIYLGVGAFREGIDPITMFKGYVFGTGIGIGYFVIVLCQFTLLTPLLLSLKSLTTHWIVIISISLAGIAYTYYFQTIEPSTRLSGFPAHALPFFVWYPFYHLGLVAGWRRDASRIPLRIIIGAVLLAFAAGLLESKYWLATIGGSFPFSQLKVSNFLYSGALFALAIRLADAQTLLHKGGVLTWLGRNSYAIYLIHMLFLPSILSLLKDSWPWSTSGLALVLSGAVLCLAVTSLTVFLLRKRLPESPARYILG